MTEFENIVIGKSSIPSLIITVILMIAIPVIFFIYWRRKHKDQTRISYLIAGTIGFLLSARVLELGVHYFCIIRDNPVSRFINGHTLAYVLYGALMAGIFEECGRYCVLSFIMKKNRTRENAVMYGIGHGGIEIIAVLIPAMITYLTIAILFSSGDIEKALSSLKITEETVGAALPSIRAAASFDYAIMAMNVIERLFAMLLHIGFTVVVFYGVVNSRRVYLLLAIFLHAVTDTTPAMYQRGLLSMQLCELIFAICTVIVIYIAVKLYRRIPSSRQGDELQGDR